MVAGDKLDWRARVLLARRSLTESDRARASTALSHAVSDLARGAAARRSVDHGTSDTTVSVATVAGYVPIGREPGALSMLDAAVAAGTRVLLPVAREPGPMQWAEYRGEASLVAAAHGLREPSGPYLPPESLADASVILVPALAVDRRGARLGRGAGYYDRTLHATNRDAHLVGVVYDSEFVDLLPSESHDVRMTHVLTPSGGLTALTSE